MDRSYAKKIASRQRKVAEKKAYRILTYELNLDEIKSDRSVEFYDECEMYELALSDAKTEHAAKLKLLDTIYYFIAPEPALATEMEARNKPKNILKLDLQKSIDAIESSHEASMANISSRYDIFIKKKRPHVKKIW